MAKFIANDLTDSAETGPISMSQGLQIDTISELTAAAGVTLDGVLLKDSEISIDVINEKTGAVGVTADGVLMKDGGITLSAGNAVSRLEDNTYSATLDNGTGGILSAAGAQNFIYSIVGKTVKVSGRATIGINSAAGTQGFDVSLPVVATPALVSGVASSYDYGTDVTGLVIASSSTRVRCNLRIGATINITKELHIEFSYRLP